METNIKGCFACGDIVGRPYQYIKAAGQGNIAGLLLLNKGTNLL
jgi:thioredoxin reductase (NADPH)